MVTDQEQHKQKLPLFELGVLALGFGICRVWVLTAMGMASDMLKPGVYFGYDQLMLFSGAVGACAVALVAWRGGAAGPSSRLSIWVLVSTAAAFVIMWCGFATGLSALVATAFVLTGIASASMQVAWGERFSRHSMHLALLAAPASALVTVLVLLAVPESGRNACFFLAPAASMLALCSHQGSAGSIILSLSPQPGEAAPLVVEEDRGQRISTGTVARLMASIAVFLTIGFCLDSFPVEASLVGMSEPSSAYHSIALIVVSVLFIVLVTVTRGRFDVLLAYRLALPVMVGGFAALTLFLDEFPLLSLTTVTAGYEFFDILFWAVLAGFVRRRGRNPIPVFGFGVAAIYVGMGAGVLLGRVVAAQIQAGQLSVTTFSLVSILVLVVVVVLVLPEEALSRLLGRNRLHPTQLDEGGLAVHCETVARLYGLTPRELDVLMLLARGRTLKVVSRELGIAEGTARTHMGHIYEKLGVHKQQELIDLVESQAVSPDIPNR